VKQFTYGTCRIVLALSTGYVATGGSSAVARVFPLWHNLKTYVGAAVGWIANTATIGNFVRLGSIGLAGLIIWLIVQDLTRDVVTIEPISVPARLAENGYTPEVAGHRMRDALNSYAGRSRTGPLAGASFLNLDLNMADRDELPDFVVPQLGLSLNAVVSSIRSVLHARSGPTISGEIIAQDKFALRIRIDGEQVYDRSDAADPDELMTEAAAAVMEKIKPSLNAIVLYTDKDKREQSVLKADEIIARFKESDVNVQWAYVIKGNDLLDKGEFPEAEKMFRKAIGLNWSNPQPHIQLGLALQGQGKLDEAIKQFQRVLGIDPKSAKAYNNIGAALVRKADLTKTPPDQAIAAYRRAIEVDPSYSLSYNNLGLVLYNHGNVDEAIVRYGEAIKVDPNYLFAHWNLAYALERQAKLDQALDHYRAAIECTKDRQQLAILHTSVGNILKQMAGTDGNLDGAIAEYRRALGYDPDYYWAHNNLGLIWDAQGKIEEAIAEFRSATKIYPEMEDMKDNLVRVLRKKEAGPPKEAADFEQ
jgi:tetratricopeptide (TPR) repeat protein